ncbi:MAG: trigger factor [Clostridia bacterium]|nr:trigger factor [Clostridia bacterium]
MSVEITKKENSKVELQFTVSKEKFNEALDMAFKKNAGKFKIAGFRNGKVPRNVIEKMYGEGVMYDEAFNIVAEEEYVKAVEENALEVVSHPEVDIKAIGKDKDLEFTITVYTKPEIKLDKYTGFEIEKVETGVTDEDVNHELTHIQEKNARIITKDSGEVVEGDIAVIDFEGFLDGVPFEGGKAEKYELGIGSHSFIPGFEEQIVGMKVGEEKDITTTFPEDYGNKELAGKETIFKIKLHEVKTKELPEIDDEFAKDVSEFDTLEEYKNDLKEKLKASKESKAKAEKESKVLEKLTEAVEVELPEPMVEHEIEHMIADFEQNLAYQGLTLDKYMEILNMKEEDLKAQFRESAIKDIKLKLALEYVVKNENVAVSQEEIDAKLEEMAALYGKEAEGFKENSNVINYMQAKLQQEKVVELIVNSAIEK